MEVCDHWMAQIHYRFPHLPEFLQNLRVVLSLLESDKTVVISDPDHFKKWLSFIKFLPRATEESVESLVLEHVRQMMKLADFKLDLIS